MFSSKLVMPECRCVWCREQGSTHRESTVCVSNKLPVFFLSTQTGINGTSQSSITHVLKRITFHFLQSYDKWTCRSSLSSLQVKSSLEQNVLMRMLADAWKGLDCLGASVTTGNTNYEGTTSISKKQKTKTTLCSLKLCTLRL